MVAIAYVMLKGKDRSLRETRKTEPGWMGRLTANLPFVWEQAIFLVCIYKWGQVERT